MDSLVAQTIKSLSAMWETHVSLDQEDPLEKEIAVPSSILGLPWWLRGAWWAIVHGVVFHLKKF